ncbi:MAG: cytochrome c [Oligoflexales bacterium]
MTFKSTIQQSAACVIFFYSCFSLPSFAKEKYFIEYWDRPQANYTDVVNPIGVSKKKLSIKEDDLSIATIHDIQYNKKLKFKGVYLNILISRLPLKTYHDLILLHFENGMIIPYFYQAHQITKAVKPLIAFSYFANKNWQHKFPKVERFDPRYNDPLPIIFSKNKLVVKTEWYPMHPMGGKSGFSPWKHMDTLTGLELVNAKAYFKQFTPGDSKLMGGFKVFISRCQYCHGIKNIGSRYGWDFAGPIPIHKKRTIDTLKNHIKNKKENIFKLGIRMPHQKDITRDEVSKLWAWMKHMTEREKLPSYQVK